MSAVELQEPVFSADAVDRLNVYTQELANEIYNKLLHIRGLPKPWRQLQQILIGNALELRLVVSNTRPGSLVSEFIVNYNQCVNCQAFALGGITVEHLLDHAFQSAPVCSGES